MKTCTMCKTEKSLDNFTFKNREKGIYQSHCRPCKKSYNVRNYGENRELRISQKNVKRDEYRLAYYQYLQTLSCTDCGLKDHRVIEFDHLGDKEYNIGEKAADMPLETLMLEIKKCEPVCANCHKIRTAERGDFYRLLRA